MRRSSPNKKVTVRALRHCFATHLLEAGANIRVIQLLLRHRAGVEMIAKHRVFTCGFAMIGFPSETAEEMRRTIDVVCKFKLHVVRLGHRSHSARSSRADKIGLPGVERTKIYFSYSKQ